MLTQKNIKRDIILYIGIMCAGIAASIVSPNRSLFFWTVNLCGLVLFVKYVVSAPKRAWGFVFLYALIGMMPCVFFPEYVGFSVKGIGLSVGVLTVPLYMVMVAVLKRDGKLVLDDVIQILKFISLLGAVIMVLSVIIAWDTEFGLIMGASNYWQVGKLGILLNGKNVYGAFLTLSTCCDLFLTKLENKKYSWCRWFLIAVKVVGVALSLSRAAQLLLAVVFLVFLWCERKNSHKEWALIFVAAAVALICVALNEAFRKLILNQILRLDVGDSGRGWYKLEALNALGAVKDDWRFKAFGVGYFGIAEVGKETRLGLDIDNTYYYTFFSGGIIKCIILLVFICIGIKHIMELKKLNRTLASACTSMLVAYLVYAEFESVPLFELGFLNFIFALFVFIIPAAYRQEIPENTIERQPCDDAAVNKES